MFTPESSNGENRLSSDDAPSEGGVSTRDNVTAHGALSSFRSYQSSEGKRVLAEKRKESPVKKK